MFYVTQLLTLSGLHKQLCSILVLTKLYYLYDYLSSGFIYHLVLWKECKVLENETICALRWNGGLPSQTLITAPSIRAVSSCYPTLTSGDRNISSVQSFFFLKYQATNEVQKASNSNMHVYISTYQYWNNLCNITCLAGPNCHICSKNVNWEDNKKNSGGVYVQVSQVSQVSLGYALSTEKYGNIYCMLRYGSGTLYCDWIFSVKTADWIYCSVGSTQ
jgi:hypothetical protein